MAWRGKFKPKNPEKYLGESANIVYRSRIELRYMQYFDTHPDIVQWASEEITIPYIKPTTGRVHRYFPDFVIRKRNADQTLSTIMVEIKHTSELKDPRPPKDGRGSRRFLNEAATRVINDAKWNAARAFCAERNWQFVVLSEKELGKNY
jgi:hypothetical protein